MTTTDRRGLLVDSVDVAVKAACRVATTAPITLEGLQTIGGVALAEGDRVLVKDQTDATTNGIYTASSGIWQRTADTDDNLDWADGTLVEVARGDVNAKTLWTCTTDTPVVLGSSTLVFSNPANLKSVLVDRAQSFTAGEKAQARDNLGIDTAFAAPTALVGLTPVAGSAQTAMRSDAAPALSQAIAPTWTGPHIWNTPVHTATQAIVTNSTAPTSGSQVPGLNFVEFNGFNTGYAIGDNTFDGFGGLAANSTMRANMTSGGGAAITSAIWGAARATAPTANLVGVIASAYGDVVATEDAYWGFIGFSNVGPNGNVHTTFAIEAEAVIAVGGQVRRRVGISSASQTSVQGSDLDAAYVVVTATPPGAAPYNTTGPWKNGFVLSRLVYNDEGPPLSADGNVFFSDSAFTTLNCMNFANVTFTGKLFNFQKFAMSGDGHGVIGGDATVIPTGSEMWRVTGPSAGALMNFASPNGATGVDGIQMVDSGNARLLFVGVAEAGNTATRFGQTLGSFAELIAFGGSSAGLLIGTTQSATPVIIGTNDVARVTVSGAGLVGIGTTVPKTTLDINKNTASPGLVQAASIMRLLAADGIGGGPEYVSFTNGAANIGPLVTGAAASGTAASPAATLASTYLLNMRGVGYTGAAWQLGGLVNIRTSQNWSGSAQGTAIDFWTTPDSTTTLTNVLRLEQSGGLTLSPAVTGGDKGAGTINISGGYYLAGTLLRNVAETLTNKTLTAPVIATIVNTGTLTLPTSTDTLVGKATTDIFTNKTFDTAGAGNVFKINGTAISDKTGTGKAVLDTSAILTTVDARGVWTTGTSWTLPAHTLGGTISGGGNQINNVVIGASSPLAGSFTTLAATSFGLAGNISAAAWTTNGVRYKNAAATLTDTTSSGTVAAAYTDLWGGNTIAASSAVTFTAYYGSYFKNPIAGTNVTFTDKYALGADSAIFGGGLSTLVNPVTSVFDDNTGSAVGYRVQNLNAGASAFSGMFYVDNTGALAIFQGFNNSTHEFRFNNIATSGVINFLIGGTSAIKIANDLGVTLGGQLYGPSIATTASAANAFIDIGTSPVGQLKRSTSMSKYKNLIRALSDEEAIHLVREADSWVYQSKAEGDDPDVEFIGFTWEGIKAADERFVSHETVQYERFVVPLSILAKRHEDRLAAIEARLAA